jgi:predicted extracellular nuclease
MSFRRPAAATALTFVGAGLLAVVPVSVASAAPSEGLVISQVYGGGGNAGATYTHDFIELYNRGDVPVSTDGLSVQYGSASGTVGTAANLRTELPALTVPPGGYVLVQEGQGNGGTTPLPTPDVTDSTPIAMSATSGKVALVTGVQELGCGAACTPEQLGRIVDLVGFGSADLFETAPVAALNNTTAALREAGGATDTDHNAEDFERTAPNPRNSGPVVPDEPTPATVAEVQGPGASSPFDGELVVVEGVVVGDFQEGGEYGGFFVQSLTPDEDELTSEGLRVYDMTPVAVGDTVRVTGRVSEYGSADSVYAGSETQLGSATVEVLSSGNALPEPVEIELPFDEAMAGVDGQERYEGMLVEVPAGLVATDLYTLGRFGEVSVTTDELLRIPTSAEEDAANNADRILLDDGRSGQNLADLPYTVDGDGGTLPRAGDVLAEPVTGVLSFGFGFYRVLPPVVADVDYAFTRGEYPRTAAPDAVGGDFQIASFNVLNYFVEFGGQNRGADDPEELARQQAKLVAAITALDADVVGLIEIANDGGEALDTLVAALNAAQPDPADHYTGVVAPDVTQPSAVGGTYGTDVIRTAIIYRASQVAPAGPPPADPALLNPADPAFPEEPLFDRPPAVQAFTPAGGGEEFTVVVNHLKSKGSTNEQCGEPDPFGGNCDDLRERQAQGLVDLVEALDTGNALLLGDFNSYEDEEPIEVLEAAGYVSAADDLPTEDRFSYSFDGEFGTLDYVFASPALADQLTGVDIWHVNSAEAPAYDYNDYNQASLYSPDAYASSDHDPVLVGLDLDQAPVADAGGPYTARFLLFALLDASGSADADGDRLTYRWDLDGDGRFDDARGAYALFWALRSTGEYTVSVQVSDGTYTSVDTAPLTVRPLFGR